MKKQYLFSLVCLIPVQTIAIEQDSVYSWGKWSQGIQPAAGPVAKVTPPPAKTPNITFRPNENSAFLREAAAVTFRQAPPVTPDAPQVPNIVIAPTDTPTTPIDRL